jgi:hypothetical protein
LRHLYSCAAGEQDEPHGSVAIRVRGFFSTRA